MFHDDVLVQHPLGQLDMDQRGYVVCVCVCERARARARMGVGMPELMLVFVSLPGDRGLMLLCFAVVPFLLKQGRQRVA